MYMESTAWEMQPVDASGSLYSRRNACFKFYVCYTIITDGDDRKRHSCL